MEDFKSLSVFVGSEGCSGLDLSATHRVFSAVPLVIFSVSNSFFFSLNFIVNDSVSANYYSQVFCSFER